MIAECLPLATVLKPQLQKSGSLQSFLHSVAFTINQFACAKRIMEEITNLTKKGRATKSSTCATNHNFASFAG